MLALFPGVGMTAKSINADVNESKIYFSCFSQEVNEQAADNQEFLAIEMINRKIRFSWNVGAGTKSITHNVILETAFGTGMGIASQVC